MVFAKAYGVEDKVEIRISGAASPITEALRVAENECYGCKVLLGVSTKGGDDARWEGLKQSEGNTSNEVIPSPVSVRTQLSATDLRAGMGDLRREWFPDGLSDEDFAKVKEILGEA